MVRVGGSNLFSVAVYVLHTFRQAFAWNVYVSAPSTSKFSFVSVRFGFAPGGSGGLGEETLFRAALCGMLVFFFFCVLGDGVTGDRKTTRGEIDDGRQEKEKEKAEFFPEKAPQKAPQKNTPPPPSVEGHSVRPAAVCYPTLFWAVVLHSTGCMESCVATILSTRKLCRVCLFIFLSIKTNFQISDRLRDL